MHSCILYKQTNNGVCNHLYVGLLFAFLKKVDVVKILMNSCLRLEATSQLKISSDLAVGFTIIDAVHASILILLCIGV